MKFQKGDCYKVDEATSITDLFESPDGANFDSVLCEIDGYHPAEDGKESIINERSQKAYYILEGSGEIQVGDQTHGVEKGHFVYVPEETRHSLEGKFKALIITSPPFDAEDEKMI